MHSLRVFSMPWKNLRWFAKEEINPNFRIVRGQKVQLLILELGDVEAVTVHCSICRRVEWSAHSLVWVNGDGRPKTSVL